MKSLWRQRLQLGHGRRAPQGARGLKCFDMIRLYLLLHVAPRKGRVG